MPLLRDYIGALQFAGGLVVFFVSFVGATFKFKNKVEDLSQSLAKLTEELKESGNLIAELMEKIHALESHVAVQLQINKDQGEKLSDIRQMFGGFDKKIDTIYELILSLRGNGGHQN